MVLHSKLQTKTARSIIKAEVIAVAAGCGEFLLIMEIVNHLGEAVGLTNKI